MNNDLGDWLRKDIWDVRAAAVLLLGFIPRQEGNGAITANLPPYRPTDPRSRDWHTELHAICLLANEAIDAGVLPHLDKRKERRVAPAAFARWAMVQGYEIPHAWQATLLSAQDAPPPTDSPPPPVAETPSPEVADESAAEKQDEPDTGRQDYLAIELDQILRQLQRAGSRIVPSTVMSLLQARAGKGDSCVKEVVPNGIDWDTGNSAEPRRLDMAALKSRLNRLNSKKTQAKP